MTGIRKVFGPFHPIDSGGKSRRHIDFHFFGVRADHSMAMWVLRYDVNLRAFGIHSIPIGDVGAKGREVIPDIGKAEVIHKDAFLDDGPIETGRVTDILRKKLRPEHFAMCTAAAILQR